MRQGRPSHSGWPVPRRLRRWIESARLTQCNPCRSAQPQTNNFIETGQERRARTCPAPTLALSPRPAPARACSTRSRRAAATGSIDRISAPVEPREHRPAHSGRPHPPPRPRSTDQGQRRRPGRRRARRQPTAPERRSHDYVRARTTTQFAALDTATGKVIGSLHRRHRAVEFKKFLAKLDREVPAGHEVHLILDNNVTHKVPAVKHRPATNMRVSKAGNRRVRLTEPPSAQRHPRRPSGSSASIARRAWGAAPNGMSA